MIYILRHGQTIWNKAQRKQGQKDSPLTLKGIEQAHQTAAFIGREIEDLSSWKIITSPLFRVQQFTCIICEDLGIPFDNCLQEPLLKEHCFGAWEGLTEEEIEAAYPGFLKKRYASWWDYIVPFGESYELISQRAQQLLEKYGYEERLIIITHEMISKAIRGCYLNLDTESILALGHPQDTVYVLDNGQLQTKTIT